MKPLPKNYDHKEAEPRWQQRWEEAKVYAWDETQPRENTFVIDTPPPTVSGVLHMGHIFSYTQADFVARYQRMSGKTVFYPMGFDDNGLPTERLVEKEKKVRGSAMPREEFVALCREVVKGAEDEFRRLFKSTALSVDWTQEYQTISDDVRKLSQASFLDLLAKGEAYRDFRPTYWDWVDQTAIAQAEIENKEMPGVMNEILFTLEDGTPLHIATTRPELLGACVAVMYHPEDPNAAKYKGKKAITPVFGVKVDMIEDSLVEREKGTGLVMCCTFGDDTDKEWQRKHQLPLRIVIKRDGIFDVSISSSQNFNREVMFNTEIAFGDAREMNYGQINRFLMQRDGSSITPANSVNIEKAIHAYQALLELKPAQANLKVIELLQNEGKLLKQTHITHSVKCAERSGKPIEIIPTPQWFVSITDKKQELISKGNQCNWYPNFMHLRLDQWIDGLKEDWCISRQRFFGVPFPVWIVVNNKTGISHLISAEIDQLPIDPIQDTPPKFKRYGELEPDMMAGGILRCTGEAQTDILDQNGKVIFEARQQVVIIPITDVMDTWATSSISPQISAHAISGNSERYKKLFPADLRPQAHEIIRTWAFYTIVKAHLHENTIPWKNLMISGWCLDANKQKMSKSKGNVVTPVDLIIDKGADVVRYWASTSRLGADTAFSEDLLKIGKKLVTKLWNATAFAAIHLTKISGKPATAAQDVAGGKITEALDKWILTRLHKTIAKATLEFERFEYCDARAAVEEFFWKDFCDNYLELVKARAYGEIGDAKSQASAHLTLYYCLDAILRLFAPFLPHITDELYSHLFEGQGSVHARGTWPKAVEYPVDAAAEVSGVACVSILEAVRKSKSERNVSIKFPIKELVLSKGSAELSFIRDVLEPVENDLKAAGNIESVRWDDAPQEKEMDDKRFSYSITFGEQAEVA